MKNDILSGKIIVAVCAPSGSGKTTLVKKMMERDKRFTFSISATSRPKRLATEGRTAEKHGVDYLFFSTKRIKEMIDHGLFIEHEEVYPDCFYGTLKSEIRRIRAMGKIALLDVDIAGALKVKENYGKKAFVIYLKTSEDHRRKQLIFRNSETLSERKKRNDKAVREYLLAEKNIDNFDLILDSVNGNPDATYERLEEHLGTQHERRMMH